MKRCVPALITVLALVAALFGCAKKDETEKMPREIINFNTGWLWSGGDYENAEAPSLDDSAFESVSLPHTVKVLTDHKGPNFQSQIESYRKVSWYRRHFTLDEAYKDSRVIVSFEGVATVADVYVNGTHIGQHKGAYTGFSYDITENLHDGDNVIAVRVDSTQRADIPPEGGPVDYCLFGGIVRDVDLIVTGGAYISDITLTTPGLTNESGTVEAAVTVTSRLAENKDLTVKSVVTAPSGKVTAEFSGTLSAEAGKTSSLRIKSADIASPMLWSTENPDLYTVTTTLSNGETVLDSVETKLGFRWFSFDDDGFYLNGKKTELVGINRHEQWPWLGRAVSDKRQRNDADLIKKTGFNAVRCSHYPQDPSFLERCDEIGLIVFEEAPGWQYIGGEEWQAVYLENIREMIKRDKNHPSIVSWGTRVNESFDNDALYTESNRIAKELDPTRPTHGVRRMESYTDSKFLDGEDIYTVNYTYPEKPRFTPFIITEHSMDWYSGHGYPWASDTDALTFTKSFAEVVDYYFGNDYCAGGFAWSMFDYDNEVNYTNTDNVFYSGLYDIFRLEKMPSWFYKSQRDPEFGEPMVYIANYNTPRSPKTVTIFSNCDEVELFVGGVSVGKKTPNLYANLPHPVYEFTDVSVGKGDLYAVGYIGGEKKAEFTVKTPGEPVKLILDPDSTTITADGADFATVAIYAVDENGTVAPYASNKVSINVEGDGKFVGEETIALEGGKAAFFVQSFFDKTGTVKATVSSDGLEGATVEISVAEFTEKTVPVSEGTRTTAPIPITTDDINDSNVGMLDRHFNYVGSGWMSGAQGGCFYSDNHYSRTANDSVDFTFTGTRIQWFGTVAPNHGIMTFSVDGGDTVTFDCYAPERRDGRLLYDSGELSDSSHTLTVTVTGRKNDASTDTYINVDRVRVNGGKKADLTKLSFPADAIKSGGYANQGSTYEWMASSAPQAFAFGSVDADKISSITVRFGFESGDALVEIFVINSGTTLSEEALRGYAENPLSLGSPAASAKLQKRMQWGYCSLVFDKNEVKIVEGDSYFVLTNDVTPLTASEGDTVIVRISGDIGQSAYFDYLVIGK